MIRFIDVLGRTLPKPRMRKLCQAIELTEVESRLMLLRCSDGLNANQISDLHGITPRQQRVLVPIINNKARLWAAANNGYFKPYETRALNSQLAGHKLPPLNGAPATPKPAARGQRVKSAYDIAVDNGFVGSQQEWLDSLKCSCTP